MSENSGPSSSGDGAVDLDALTLRQALIDVEVANERVRDLTFRLLSTTRTLGAVRADLADEKRRADELERRVKDIEETRAYRTAHRLWELRSVLRV